MEVNDIAGKPVFSTTILPDDDGFNLTTLIDYYHFCAGPYFITIFNEAETLRQKLIVVN